MERKRYPQYEHVAVIVAEEITSRFLNVIQLFNGAIPLIAVKMTAYKVGDQYALTFVTVLDERTYGLVDEDEPISEPSDRTFWQTRRGTKKTLATTDDLFAIVRDVVPAATIRYNKHYIGLEIDGTTRNFVSFAVYSGGPGASVRGRCRQGGMPGAGALPVWRARGLPTQRHGPRVAMDREL